MNIIKCGEIWGGVRGTDVEATTSGVDASLFSYAHEGSDRGGDIYYFSVCGSNKLTRIALADVTGHGEAVSDTSEWLYSALSDRMNSRDGHEVLSDLNRLAVDYGYKAISTAAVCGYYRETNELFFSYAGHHPVMIRSQSDGQWCKAELSETPGVNNLPLGVDACSPYEQSAIRMQSGDLLFLYTDGQVEARNSSSDPFGDDRLIKALQCGGDDARDVKQTVLQALTQHQGSQPLHDDVTFMAVQIK